MLAREVGYGWETFTMTPLRIFSPSAFVKFVIVTFAFSNFVRYALEENDGGWGFVAHTGKEEGGSCLL